MRRLHVALQSRRKASDDWGAGSADAAKAQNDVALSLPVEEDHSLRGVAPVAPIPRAVVVQVVVRHHHSVWPIRRSKAVLDAAALQVRFQVREEERNSGLAEVLVPARFLRVVGLLKRDVAVGADPDPAVLLPVEEDLAAGLAHHIHIGCRVVFKIQPLPLALAAERLQQGLARIHQASRVSVVGEDSVLKGLVLHVEGALRGEELRGEGRGGTLGPFPAVPLLLEHAGLATAALPLHHLPPPGLISCSASVGRAGAPLLPRTGHAVGDLRARQIGNVQEKVGRVLRVAPDGHLGGRLDQRAANLLRRVVRMVLQMQGHGPEDVRAGHGGAARQARVVILPVPRAHDVRPGRENVDTGAVVGETGDVVVPVGR
mmetsp:Transcript_5086/g.12997  ORF Transcript_5086/g.12997 Transcript_5086/m.12997 type:complete len:373 (-) Transcript_5086:796-1914(-)